MKAVTFKDYGDASVLEINEIEKPSINDDEVLIKVAAAGINRPDILQRSGFYPPPKEHRRYWDLRYQVKLLK